MKTDIKDNPPFCVSAEGMGWPVKGPIIVPLASIAVFWLPPESRKCLKRLSGARFESYSAHHTIN